MICAANERGSPSAIGGVTASAGRNEELWVRIPNMPLARFSKLEPTKKTRIIQIATEEFAERGYEKASLNRIVVGAGMSKGSLYYYFADKDDLYRTVLKAYSERMLQIWSGGSSKRIPAFSRIRTAEEYWDAWVHHWRRSLGNHERNPVEAKLFGQCIRQRAAGTSHPALTELAAELRNWVREVLKRGQRIGAVRTDLDEELLLDASFGMMEGFDRWLDKCRQSGETGRTEEWADLAVELLRRIVEPSQSRAGTKKR